MSELALIDSNLLVYVFDEGEPKKRRICANLVRECWEGKANYAVSVQNLSEFYVAACERVERPMPKEVAERFVELVVRFENWRVLCPTGHTVLSAIRIHREFDVPYWDALIAATMRENGVTRIHTEDEKSFRKIPWLEVVNPLGKGREGSRQSKTGGT